MSENVLVQIVEKTSGWVLFAIVLAYFVYQVIMKHIEGRALSDAMKILRDTVGGALGRIEESITRLTGKLETFLEKW